MIVPDHLALWSLEHRFLKPCLVTGVRPGACFLIGVYSATRVCPFFQFASFRSITWLLDASPLSSLPRPPPFSVSGGADGESSRRYPQPCSAFVSVPCRPDFAASEPSSPSRSARGKNEEGSEVTPHGSPPLATVTGSPAFYLPLFSVRTRPSTISLPPPLFSSPRLSSFFARLWFPSFLQTYAPYGRGRPSIWQVSPLPGTPAFYETPFGIALFPRWPCFFEGFPFSLETTGVTPYLLHPFIRLIITEGRSGPVPQLRD